MARLERTSDAHVGQRLRVATSSLAGREGVVTWVGLVVTLRLDPLPTDTRPPMASFYPYQLETA